MRKVRTAVVLAATVTAFFVTATGNAIAVCWPY